MFYGILVLMFFRDNRRHHLPHIHVRYQGDEAAISIEDGSMLDGSLPPKQLKMNNRGQTTVFRQSSLLLPPSEHLMFRRSASADFQCLIRAVLAPTTPDDELRDSASRSEP
jgi:hypothetical protein